MKRLVLVRHGQSLWNLENKFTGWVDVPLSERGMEEAREAARLMAREKFGFDCAYTSLLKRAIKTLWVIQEEMDLMWLPVHRSWRLNERHYGALQGLDKAETARRHGEEQVLRWRRSYDLRPPALSVEDETNPARDPRYAGLRPEEIPLAESLQDTIGRFLPYWEEVIAPAVREGKRVLIVAHGNSLRGLVKVLDRLSNDDVVGLNIPTGIPLVYELNDDLTPIRHYYMGDPARVERAVKETARPGRTPK